MHLKLHANPADVSFWDNLTHQSRDEKQSVCKIIVQCLRT